MSDKKTMLTAKYDMKMLKQIVEIDEQMKSELCKLEGVEDEDSLPEDIQNLDLQDYLGFSQEAAKKELLDIFVGSLSSSKESLDSLAADVSKRSVSHIRTSSSLAAQDSRPRTRGQQGLRPPLHKDPIRSFASRPTLLYCSPSRTSRVPTIDSLSPQVIPPFYPRYHRDPPF